MKDLSRKESGFTAIEIIAVILIIGIISAVTVSRIQDSSAETAGARQVIKNHIRYAQLMAMKSNNVCGIQFQGSFYTVFRNGSLADTISLSNNGIFTIPAGLAGTSEIIYFDLWGTPYTDPGLTSQRATGLIGNLGITIYADTGYVQ